MKQKDREKKLTGAQGFDAYYSNLFGERWQAIKNAFSLAPDYAEWKSGGEKSYFLDSASVRAAVSLPLENASDILDLCAAPGGKTLVLACNMGENAQLLSNERSPERKNRLLNTVRDCLPQEIQSRVQVICKDGAVMCRANESSFDAILLDAPCSSERHVLADEKYLSEWSPSRIKTLSMAQWALLSSAWRMLRAGGYLLYSTCALSPDENDCVIEKLLKKFDDAKLCEPKIALNYNEFTKSALPEYEKTQFGAHVLPDKANGAGPLYFCLLQKNH
ncbi:MAG: RsmB/NOP family class I SAM-dependent RNA methyltransferase [Treponema sp.]|nr:RsmB/NOP family class I SAM-dependent RNA methyltransferase [Treponema sp.]